VISLDRSLILVKAVLGLSGGKLVALEEVDKPRVKLDVEDLASLARDGREPFKFVLLADLLLASLSNTLLLPLVDDVDVVLVSFDFDNLSIIEFLRVTGFFKSFSE